MTTLSAAARPVSDSDSWSLTFSSAGAFCAIPDISRYVVDPIRNVTSVTGSRSSQPRYSGPSKPHQFGYFLAVLYPSREVIMSTTNCWDVVAVCSLMVLLVFFATNHQVVVW